MERLLFILIAFLLQNTLAVPPLQSSLKEFDEFDLKHDAISSFPISHKISNHPSISPRHILPKDLIPKFYTIELHPLLVESNYGTIFTCPGKVDIFVECVTSTRNITLHSVNQIRESSVRVIQYENSTVEHRVSGHYYDMENEKEFYTIELEQELEAGHQYTIHIEYVAKIFHPDERQTGMYHPYFIDQNNITRHILAANFEPTDARRSFPCFDEPELKANFQMNIIRLENEFISLSNTDRIGEPQILPDKPGWVKDIFRQTELMPTYLVCMAVLQDYKYISAHEEHYSLPVNIWGPSQLIDLGAGDYSGNFSAKILQFYETFLNRSSVLNKLDKLALTHFPAGALENWGLNNYIDRRLLWIDGITPVSEKVDLSSTIAHEVVHQWYGNQVTMKWWDDLWLNEGFARYFSSIGVHGVSPEFDELDTFINEMVHLSMIADARPGVLPLHNDVLTPTEIWTLFGTITYQKGGSMLRMLNGILGENDFNQAMKDYLAEFALLNANQEDLFQVVQGFSPGLNVPVIMSSWCNQPGFPLIIVKRDFVTGSVSFRQEKFRTIRTEPELTLWHIPLFYSISGGNMTNPELIWFENVQEMTKTEMIDDPQKWLIVNPSKIGYYRVIYDEHSFNMIATQLDTNHLEFTPETRASLIDDHFSFANAYYGLMKSALRLTTYLYKEEHYLPFESLFANQNLGKVHRMLSRSSIFVPFREYMLSKIKGPLTKLGFQIRDSDYLNVRNKIYFRSALIDWACNLKDPDCLNFAKTSFESWMSDPSNTSIIFPDLQPTVYCHALAASAGDSIWDFILEQYQTFDRLLFPETMRLNLIRALSCSSDTYKINRLLSIVMDLNSEIRNEHKMTVMQSLTLNSNNADLTFNFLRNNYDVLLRRYGPSFFSQTISSLSNIYNKEYEYDQVEQFIEEKADELSSVKPSLDASLDNIDSNIEFMYRYETELRNFFAENLSN